MIEESHVLQALGRTACTLIILVSTKELLQNPLKTERLFSSANNCILLGKYTRAQCVHSAAHLSRISQQVLLVTSHVASLILQG